MVAHLHEHMNAPAGAPACLLQRVKKNLAILAVPKNRLAPVLAGDDVLNRPRKFNSRFSGHGPKSCTADVKCHISKDCLLPSQDLTVSLCFFNPGSTPERAAKEK